MFYTIYKITCKINGKFYIGMHQTTNLNDGYMGSGKLIKLAIKKHGIDSFTKEILHIFDNEDDMKAKEKELVIISEQSYNLCEGGQGGFSYLNRSGLASRSGAKLSDETKEKIRVAKSGTVSSDETKQKISENNGMKNPEISSRVAEKLRGKEKDEAHKEKIRQAIKDWHARKKQ